MKQKKTIFIWSLFCMALYLCLLAVVSLSPIAGKNTEFGTPAMLGNLFLVAASYGIPMILYGLGISAMRYFLGVVQVFWSIPLPFLILFGLMANAYFQETKGQESLVLLLSVLLSVLCLMANILWFIFCLRRKEGSKK